MANMHFMGSAVKSLLKRIYGGGNPHYARNIFLTATGIPALYGYTLTRIAPLSPEERKFRYKEKKIIRDTEKAGDLYNKSPVDYGIESGLMDQGRRLAERERRYIPPMYGEDIDRLERNAFRQQRTAYQRNLQDIINYADDDDLY